MTAWKKIFNVFYNDAFGTTENKDKESIQRVFGIIKQKTSYLSGLKSSHPV